MMNLILEKPEDFSVLSGDDNLAFPLTAVGGKGVVSVASNYFPGQMSEMIDAALAGAIDKARKIHYRLLPLFKALFIETNPIPIKYIMARKGMIEEVYRLPLCPMSDENKAKVDAVIDSLE